MDTIDSVNADERRAYDSDLIDTRPEASFPVLTEET